MIIGALIISAALRAFVGQMFIIPSDSMQNTLLRQDRVAVQKLTDIRRGQVVVFADPGGWLPESPATQRGPIGRALQFVGVLPETTTDHLIKRVMGMPGDRVICCDSFDRITVNGHPLEESDYLYRGPDQQLVNPSDFKFDVVVPEGRIFVMGDHRNASGDSRCHLADVALDQGIGQVAFVPLDLVVGQAFAITLPVDRTTRLGIPQTFADVPPPSAAAPDKAVIHIPQVTC